MKKLRLKRWVKVVLTLVAIHISFFIWKQAGIVGRLSQTSDFYLVMCWLTWIYLLIGQVFIYKKIWE